MAVLPSTGSLYLALYLISAGFSAVLAYWVAVTQQARGWKTFVVTVSVGACWALAVAAHIATANPRLMAVVLRFELWFGLVAATLWLVFASQYTGEDLHRRRPVQALLVAVPVVYVVATATNGFHHLMWVDTEIFRTPFSHASSIRGPGYFATLAIIYAYVGYSMHLLGQFLLSTRRGTGVRLGLLASGVVLIVALNVLSILELTPVPTFDHAGLGMLPFNLAAALAIFELDFLEVEPVARNRLVETVPDAVVVLDADHRVADYNRAATELWPDLDDHLGDDLSVAVPDLADQLDLQTDDTVRTEEVTLSTDATEGFRHYSVLVSPISRDVTDERPPGYGLLLRDITELEEYRRELERQNDQLDQFASAVSHDLRNPLTVADGHAEILWAELSAVDDPADLDLEDLQNHAEQVTTSHDRIERIIDDLLTMAREGSGTGDRQPCEFGRVATDAWAVVDTGGGNLSVERDGIVRADPGRLQSIFENLFRNAVEHAGPAPRVRVGVTADGFYVEDDGPGIPPEQRGDVFEYGYTDDPDGTGLGLSIVQTMADSHGWDVTVEDAVGTPVANGGDGQRTITGVTDDDPPRAAGARFLFTGAYTERDATTTEESTADQSA